MLRHTGFAAAGGFFIAICSFYTSNLCIFVKILSTFVLTYALVVEW